MAAGSGAGPGAGSCSARRQPFGTEFEHKKASPRGLRGTASRRGTPGAAGRWGSGSRPAGLWGWGWPRGAAPRGRAGPGGRLSRRGVAARRLQSGRRGRRGRFSRLASRVSRLIPSRRIPRPEPCCTGDTTSTTVRASRPGAEASGAVRGRPGMGWRSGRVSVRGSLCGIVVRTVPALSSAPAVCRSAAPCRHRRPSFHTHGEMLWGLGCFVLPFISAFLQSPRCAQQKA